MHVATSPHRAHRPAAFGLRLSLLVTGWTLISAPGCGPMAGDRDALPTLGATIVDGVPSDSDDDLLSSAGTDGEEMSISFEAKPAFCCNALSIGFQVVTSGNVPSGVTHEWDFGDQNTGQGSAPQHTYAYPADFTVILRSRFPNGARRTIERVLALSYNEAGATEVTVTPPPESPDDPGPEGPDGDDEQPGETEVFAVANFAPSAEPGDVVTLDGSLSEGTGAGPLAFEWKQILGIAVALDGAGAAVATFVAPETPSDSDEELRFRLTVRQDDSVATLDVVVTVHAVPAIPDADGDEETDPASDPDDGGDDEPDDPDDPDEPNGQNTLPTVSNQAIVIDELDWEPVTLTLLGSDADGDDLTFVIDSPPSHGTLGPIDNSPWDSASVTYFPEPEFMGSTAFTFKAGDGVGESDAATFIMFIVDGNLNPIVEDRFMLLLAEPSNDITLSAMDINGDDLTFSIVSGPEHGSIEITDNSPFDTAQATYTADPGYLGPDSFSFIASDDELDSATATVTFSRGKSFVPWIELNLPDTPASDLVDEEDGALPMQTIYDFGVMGLNLWGDVVDTAIITTLPAEAQGLYTNLMVDKPAGMKIVGGFKTFPFIPGAVPYNPQSYDFTDADAWVEIAARAETVTAITGVNIVVLENETTLFPYHTEGAPIDYGQLDAVLEPLVATGIEIWWFLPMVLPNSGTFPDREAETSQFVQAVVDAVPNSRFIAGYVSRPNWQDQTWRVENREDMIGLVGIENLLETLFVTRTGLLDDGGVIETKYKSAESIEEMVGLPIENLNVIYPGYKNWFLVAEDFVALQPPLFVP